MSLVPEVAAPPTHSLADHIVLVTGGAQGIGRGIAQAVLGAGGSVAIADLDRDAGVACLHEWQVGERAMFVRLDVSKESAVATAMRRIVSRFGRLDGLVNNAGIADPHSGPLDELSLRDWRRWQDSHVTGTFLCSRAALPALREANGTIVNIASTRALQSEPHTEAYAAAKGAIVAFTHALAISEGPVVRVNCISPGWIATDDWRKPAARRTPKLSREDHAQHPAGRVGTPPDIGALVVYLLGAEAGFITGQNFVVDGGMTRWMRYS
jgi:NAD(P)-dependent dehydrogenase (short-subunit alcohol dehydrogenase family)